MHNNSTITLKEGKVRGMINKLFDGSDYYSYKGIPYAQPPLGDLRFKAPVPLKPWIGVHEATQHGPVCPQFDMTTPNKLIEGDENCLFINVYTKTLSSDSKQPVMVFIHGGAFMSGSGNSDLYYGPEFLLQHNVVLVTFNYRLETLGFLCLDTADVSGNASMKDQVLALQWVQKNIKKFGGNPDNVTLFGGSAGGISIAYHMLSPMSEGLFHKAINQSGSGTNAKWIQTKGKERAFFLAKSLGKETSGENVVLDFLQKISPLKLVMPPLKVMSEDEKHRGLPIHFVPSVEKEFKNVKSFLNTNPIDLILDNKIEFH